MLATLYVYIHVISDMFINQRDETWQGEAEDTGSRSTVGLQSSWSLMR